MDSIYLVTAGDHSDYGVIAAFSTQEKAEEYSKAYDSRGYAKSNVEEFELDPSPETYTYTRVVMDETGDSTTELRTQFVSDCRLGFLTYWEFLPGNLAGKRGYGLVWNVHTDDKERAVKVVDEKRAQILANELWGNSEATKRYFNA